ncbi:MAG: sigma-70 family RNA polymerase sigma factor [Myxococcales bacterium]|nr:sigma-70 family RNA polymerase sigma factor [Myxococcales bacterium]
MTNRRLERRGRWTAEQERQVGREIRDAEARALQAIRGIPEADEILGARPRRTERTRAGEVSRLEQAIHGVWLASKARPDLKERARAARHAWEEAEGLRWNLAMSGRRIAYGEARKLAGPFMDEADLVQEGFIGLLRAAKRFDPERAIRFSTYARWWVRAQMTRAIDHHGRPVRLPGGAVEQTRNLRKVIQEYELAGADYTVGDLAREVGIDERRARFLLAQGKTVSIDEPVEEGPRQRTLDHFLEDEEAVQPEDEAIRVQELEGLRDAFHALSERHQHVIARRYGLDDDRFRTLSEVGETLNLSRERVRQIEREALGRLKDGEIRNKVA